MSGEPIPHTYQLYVGVDIAAKSFTAYWAGLPRTLTLAQSPNGFATLCQHLQATTLRANQVLVVMEATSTYWTALAVALNTAGFHLSIVNPAQIHNFACSLPRRAKTDALDAQLIAQFAQERHPALWTPPPVVYHELRQRLQARDALLEARKQLRNQQHALAHWPVQVSSVQDHRTTAIADLDARIVDLETEIEQCAPNGAWAASIALLETIPGIGLLTAAWLVVLTLNFSGFASVATLVAYAGLAPFERESGSSVRGRPIIGGGNARLHTALYMATLRATQHNPQLRTFYKRLRDRGKPMKVARCAAARKLLELAYAVVKNERPFDRAYMTTRSASSEPPANQHLMQAVHTSAV